MVQPTLEEQTTEDLHRHGGTAEPEPDTRRAHEPRPLHDDDQDHDHGHGHSHAVQRGDFFRIGFVALAAAAVWFRVWEPFEAVSLLGVAGVVIGGWPIFREAVENSLERRMTMELSMTIALVAALLIGEFFTALIIALFVLIAEVLEGLTVARGRTAIKDLLDFLPRTATVRRDGRQDEVRVEEVRPGDIVLVRPGALLPVDGEVVSGHSFVEEAAITGEPVPAEKLPGAVAYAGTLNQSGALEIRAVRLGRDTGFGRIVEAVEEAEHSRAPIQKTADRLAGYLVYFALGAALLTFLITGDVRSTIAVVIVAGACGIAAGTPLAILGGIGQTARRGSIVKGGLFLELLARVDEVVLDKTGTLTFGAPEVEAVRSANSATEAEVLEAAAVAEGPSEHPLGRAIVRYAREKAVPLHPPSGFHYTPGRGVVAEFGAEKIVAGNRALLEEQGYEAALPASRANGGASEVLVARGGRVLGSIQITDRIRPEAIEAVAALRGMGIRTTLLSGDRADVAEAVASDLGMDAVEGGLLPEMKRQRIEEMVAAGRTVAMVGDGINDAPALAAAHVGVAMGSGTDVARESADVVLIGNDLSKFVDTLRIARRTRGVIMQNFVGTLAVDGIGVGLAAFGMLSPLLAAFIHVASELAFILNSARLLPAVERDGR